MGRPRNETDTPLFSFKPCSLRIISALATDAGPRRPLGASYSPLRGSLCRGDRLAVCGTQEQRVQGWALALRRGQIFLVVRAVPAGPGTCTMVHPTVLQGVGRDPHDHMVWSHCGKKWDRVNFRLVHKKSQTLHTLTAQSSEGRDRPAVVNVRVHTVAPPDFLPTRYYQGHFAGPALMRKTHLLLAVL